MPRTKVENVRVAGMSSAVPALQRAIRVEQNRAGRGLPETTGIREVCVAPNEMCTSDLCCAAASQLMSALNWPPESVEGLIFLTQTPDYILPATSCSLQKRLGLPTDCAALDVNLGCSGYIYGLWLGGLMVSGGIKRLLLLAGDTLTKLAAPEDRVSQLFGDAGTATALEYLGCSPSIYLHLGTDGGGLEHLFVPAAGFRTPSSADTCTRERQEEGNIRSPEDIYMNATEVFLSTLTRIPPLVHSVLKAAGWSAERVDALILNQTSRFALQNIASRTKIPQDRLILALEDFGNTSSASIPLAMTTQMGNRLRAKSSGLILAAFGAGYSWGAAALDCGPIILPDLVRLTTATVERGSGL